ncbi:MAG TPA: hypothetical protein VLG11_02950 [Candidatus Saccharimonadales bacterium]|nr:hypothetical protein [Candidatus Saccharimonadales bacterium]
MSSERPRNGKWRPDLGAPGIGRLITDEAVHTQNNEILSALADEVKLPLLPNPRLGLLYFTEDMLVLRGIESGGKALEIYQNSWGYRSRLAEREVPILLKNIVHMNTRGVVTREVIVHPELKDEMRVLGAALSAESDGTRLNTLGLTPDGKGMLLRIGQLASRVRDLRDAPHRERINETLMAAPWEEGVAMLAPLQAIEPDPRWRQLDGATYGAMQDPGAHNV